jgi:hypothetical protein
MPGASRNQLLARLHCIKRDLGWDDATYRDVLYARTGCRSAADLDGSSLARIVAQLGEGMPKIRRGGGGEWAFIDGAERNKRPLLRKICAICRAMGVGRDYAEGVARRQHGFPRRLEMMDAAELHIVAGALARTQAFRKRQ